MDPVRGNIEPWLWRLLSFVGIGDGCWVWYGWKTQEGYGGFTLKPEEQVHWPRTLYAHRIMHEIFVGPIPEGWQVDHLCFNTGCCNPDHLEAVPQLVNLKRRTQVCRKGHWLEGNRKLFKSGTSRCLKCWNDNLESQRLARRQRGLKRPGRKPSNQVTAKE